jgi:hypothetical protein
MAASVPYEDPQERSQDGASYAGRTPSGTDAIAASAVIGRDAPSARLDR